MTIVFSPRIGWPAAIGSADGGVIQRWSWALVNNPVAERTADGVVLAIGANLAMGLLLALVYARYAEPRLHGPSWWRGMQFALIPWLLSLIVFLPLMGGGVLGMGVGAGPLPILGNLILHLVYGAVLGSSYAEATEDWLDDTEVDRVNAAAAERGAASWSGGGTGSRASSSGGSSRRHSMISWVGRRRRSVSRSSARRSDWRSVHLPE